MSENTDARALAIFNDYKTLCEDVESRRGKYTEIYERVKLVDLPGSKERAKTWNRSEWLSLLGVLGILIFGLGACISGGYVIYAILGLIISVGLIVWGKIIQRPIKAQVQEDKEREVESHKITRQEIDLMYPKFDEFYDLWLKTKNAKADERNRKLLKGAAIAGAIVVGVTGAMAAEAYKETKRS